MIANFNDKLRIEISETQKSRKDYVIKKITFLLTLIGIGSIKIADHIDMYKLHYIIPAIAVGFDLYIAGEDFSIKRIGKFLSIHSHKDERNYETFVSNHRDYFSIFANMLFSLIIIIISAFIINMNELIISKSFILLFVIYAISIIIIQIIIFCQRKKLMKSDTK